MHEPLNYRVFDCRKNVQTCKNPERAPSIVFPNEDSEEKDSEPKGPKVQVYFSQLEAPELRLAWSDSASVSQWILLEQVPRIQLQFQ